MSENSTIIHEENNIEVRNIRSLSDLNFYIPDYQRGYRWTPSLVIQMLNDFKEFIKNTKNSNAGGFYCLQPVVVKPFEKDGKIFYEVIDGQQRLTTLWLILKHLDSKIQDDYSGYRHYSFTYQTPRQKSGASDFFNVISSPKPEKLEFVDYFYMNIIYQAIAAWFKDEKNEGMKSKIASLLLDKDFDENKKDHAKNVRVIWYEIGKNEPASVVDIFTRLNIGKIPLTNAELIKASFLQKSNNKDNSLYRVTDNIAREWDEIEHKLQNDKFWYFLRPSKDKAKKVYDTRIEYIFDLLAEWNSDREFYWTFNHFADLISKNGPESTWKDIKQYFRELEYWYADNTLFHLIGFLIECGVGINQLKPLTFTPLNDEEKEKGTSPTKRTKSEFLSAVKKEIIKQMEGIDVKNLKFNDDAALRKTLLLFNILTVANNRNSYVRFPFDKFKDSKYSWDKEHIASQTDHEKRPKGDKRNPWVNDMLYYFTGINIRNIEGPLDSVETAYLTSLENYLLKYDDKAGREDQKDHKIIKNFIERLIAAKKLLIKTKRDKEETALLDKKMNSLYDDTDAYFTGDEVDDKDNIGNMALLNYDINRSYGNAFFAIKRMIIRDFDESGTFIPIATRNAFMKYYSKRVDNMMYWTQDDSDAYRDAIVSTLDEYLTIK